MRFSKVVTYPPWSDGTRLIFFSGEEFVARLTALVPPPRMHMVHY